MKKRTKITLRTKIYLAIAGLSVAVSGILYAANPFPFSTGAPVFPGFPSDFYPTGVAASPDLLLVTPFCTEDALSIDCNGAATVFATFPGFGSCREKYLAVAPSMSANSGFTPRDVFATEGRLIFKVSSGAVTLFADLGPGCTASDHNGLSFDHFGTYGNDMIVTCQEGVVFRVNGTGTVTHIATLFPPDPATHAVEGPAVVPPLFGPHGGKIWVADENAGAVHAVGLPPTYTVTLNILSHVSAEGVYVIPNPPCANCGNSFYNAEQQLFRLLWAYPASDFVGLGGNVILVSEQGADFADTSLVTTDGTNYFQTSFGPRPPGIDEGSSMVDCNVPTATPTSKPTATSTPKPTATASATFTPTPTATFTPTPTATFTPTPTPTPTPTGTVGLPCPAGSFEGGNTGGMGPGDISIVYDQFPAPNDNSYGDNAVGWGSKGHTFGDLTGSDKAGFQIIRPNNTVAVSFNVDYITASNLGSPPSGYRSLGPFGGDGGIVVNSTPALVNNGTQIQWDTSFARNLNGPAVWAPTPTWPNPTYFMGGVQTIGLPPGTNTADLQEDSPPVDCSLATDPNCITQYGAPKGIQYPLAVPNPWIKSYDNPEFTNGGGPITPGALDAAHVDGWNFHDTFFVTFKQAYLTAIGFDFGNFAIAAFDPATNTFTCPSNKWCIAPNPTALHNSPAKPCPSGPCQFSTSIASNFNAGPIAAGNYIWFNSILKPTDLGSNPVTITFSGQTITSANFNLNVPDATVTFDPNVDFATTTFGAGGVSMTTVPSDPPLKGNTFFSALSFQVPANLPGGINPVTWSGTISVDRPGVIVAWKWAAAVYTNFSTAYNLLGVKPVDEKVQNPYLNSDHAGTPENFKQFVIGGARGGGGSNFTGSYSGTAGVVCGQVQRR